MGDQRLVIPVVFPDPEPYPHPSSMIESLSGFEVTLLGYYEVPSGSDTMEVRRAHETDVMAVLYELAAGYAREGVHVDLQVHFGADGAEEREFRDRIVEESDADAVLMSNPVTKLTSVLVAVRNDRYLDSIVEVVGALDGDSVLDVEVLHVARDERRREAGEELTADVEDRLVHHGFPRAEIERTVEVDGNPGFHIGRRGRHHDLVVIGESDRTEIDHQIFGPTFEYVATETRHPVMVVRA